jgi:hypothetical protein
VALDKTSVSVSRATGFLRDHGVALAIAAAGASFAAQAFLKPGASAEDSITGIVGMTAAGASLGMTFGQPVLGAAIGFAVGGIGALTNSLLDGGESVDAYRKRIAELGTELEGLGTKAATAKFVKELGFTDLVALAQGGTTAVRGIRDELTALAAASPAAAQKVLAGLKDMKDEAGKPLFTGREYDLLIAAIDKGIAKRKEEDAAKRDAESTNKDLLATEASLESQIASEAVGTAKAADAWTNRTRILSDGVKAMERYAAGTLDLASADAALQAAQGALNEAILSGDTAYVDAVIALGVTRAAMDEYAQSTIAAKTPLVDVTLGTKTLAAEQAASATASQNASVAAYRYAEGTISAKDATAALSASVAALRQQLALALGNYLSQEQAQLNLNTSLDAVTASTIENGLAVDLNTAQGRENAAAILQAGQAAIQTAAAYAQNGASAQAQAAPLQSYRDQMQRVRDSQAAAGQDTSFVDGIIANTDRALREIEGRVPRFDADGKLIGYTLTNGTDVGTDGMPVVGDQAGKQVSDALRNNEEYARSAGYAIGWAMVQGIISGIGDGDVTGTLFNVIDNAISAAENKYTGSPSPQTRDLIGKPLGQGIAAGIESQAGAVDAAMSRVVNGAIDGANIERIGGRAYRPFHPGSHHGRESAERAIEFNIAVSGVSNPAVARTVGEQIGEGAVDALTRRGYVTTARLG